MTVERVDRRPQYRQRLAALPNFDADDFDWRYENGKKIIARLPADIIVGRKRQKAPVLSISRLRKMT
jgi:hypothetical protein